MDDAARLDEYPRQFARTQGFSYGQPKAFTVSPDGSRVVFLRSKAGDDAVLCVWVLDVASGQERCLFDPRGWGAAVGEGALSQAELDRRERAGERSSGVTAYATDEAVRRLVFTLSGRPFIADLEEGWLDELTVPGDVDDPRLDPTGRRVAYVVGGALHVRDLEGGNRVLAADDDPDTFWGLAEFVAAEEMHRDRGHWWSPDGRLLAATHVDERAVTTLYLPAPGDPTRAPRPIRFPLAGTDNAVVTLFVFDVATGARTEVEWDREAFPYLARVHWSEGGPLTLLVRSRDQRQALLLEADATTGTTTTARAYEDPLWIDLPDDAPVRLADGRVVMVERDVATDTDRITIDGEPVTPPGLQVRSVLSGGDGTLFRASEDPMELHLWRWTSSDGAVRLSAEPGVHNGARADGVLVLTSSTLERPLPSTTVTRDGAPVAEVRSLAETPVVEPRPILLRLGERELPSALLLPGGREPEGPVPVLLDPYGGPGPLANRVWRASGAYLTPQWLADHGLAVLVVDGRGMDGRGPSWHRLAYQDLVGALDDQVEALHAAASRFGFLDLSRVALRGSSFGGYLAVAAVLRRPDVFRAAIGNASATDFRMYDTHWSEQYLGHPDEEPGAYDRNSMLVDVPRLTRPLLLIHGLTDDNVHVAHTLRLSSALFAAGGFHELVLLPGGHRTGSEVVTENLLRAQVDFLRRTLGLDR